jgi:hypothetical protein
VAEFSLSAFLALPDFEEDFFSSTFFSYFLSTEEDFICFFSDFSCLFDLSFFNSLRSFSSSRSYSSSYSFSSFSWVLEFSFSWDLELESSFLTSASLSDYFFMKCSYIPLNFSRLIDSSFSSASSSLVCCSLSTCLDFLELSSLKSSCSSDSS